MGYGQFAPGGSVQNAGGCRRWSLTTNISRTTSYIGPGSDGPREVEGEGAAKLIVWVEKPTPYEVPNFRNLKASKSWMPPPTRLVV